MKLSPSDRLVLSELFESDSYKLLHKHFLLGEWEAIARRALQATDYPHLQYLKGQASALQQLHAELKKINKEEHQKEAK